MIRVGRRHTDLDCFSSAPWIVDGDQIIIYNPVLYEWYDRSSSEARRSWGGTYEGGKENTTTTPKLIGMALGYLPNLSAYLLSTHFKVRYIVEVPNQIARLHILMTRRLELGVASLRCVCCISSLCAYLGITNHDLQKLTVFT